MYLGGAHDTPRRRRQRAASRARAVGEGQRTSDSGPSAEFAPLLAALRAWDPVVGLVVGSYQGCSEELHALAREVAEERARTEWRQMGARSEHEALGS